MLGTILIVILILALFGALPRWSHSRDWGYAPTGGLGLVLCIVVILLVLGRISSVPHVAVSASPIATWRVLSVQGLGFSLHPGLAHPIGESPTAPS